MTYKYSPPYYMQENETTGQQAHIHEEAYEFVRCQGYSMLSSQIEWTWVHWCAAKPTHLATLVLSVPLLSLSLSLSLSLPSTLFTLLFPSATYFLSPCLRFSSCPHQFSPPSYLSTALLIWLIFVTLCSYEFSLLSVLKLGRAQKRQKCWVSH